jgi:molybdopterin-guanine dinucleotide biosynthesis protein A
MHSESYSGVILAGGLNSRYGGRDKAFIEIEGQSILDRTIATFQTFFSEIIIVSNTIDSYPTKYQQFKLTSDTYKEIGPLGGLHAAMKVCTTENMMVVSCDMPNIAPNALQFLIDYHSTNGGQALIPTIKDKMEPLHAIYQSSLLSKLEAHIENQNKRSIRSFLNTIDTTYVSDPQILKFVKSFMNINSPEDFNKYIQDSTLS